MASFDEFLKSKMGTQAISDSYGNGLTDAQVLADPYAAANRSQAIDTLSRGREVSRNVPTLERAVRNIGNFAGNTAATLLNMPAELLSAANTVATEGLSSAGILSNSAADASRRFNQDLLRGTNELTEPIREFTSSPWSREAAAIEGVLQEEATARNDAKYIEDLASGESSTMAALKRLGRGFADSTSIAFAQQDTATNLGNVAGSIAGMAGAIRGIGAGINKLASPIDRALTESAYKAGLINPRTAAARRAGIREEGSSAGRAFTEASVIGGLAGAQAQTDTYDKVKNIPIENLQKSDKWNDLLKEFKGNEKAAREAMALRISSGTAGLTDFITGAVAQRLGIGTLAANPLLRGTNMSTKDALNLITRNSIVQDMIEEATPIAVANKLISGYDPEQSLVSGVAEAAGQALPSSALGMGLHAPGVARIATNAGINAAREGLNNIRESRQQRVDQVEKEVEQSSPTSNEAVKTKFAEAGKSYFDISGKAQETNAQKQVDPTITPEELQTVDQDNQAMSYLDRSMLLTPEEKAANDQNGLGILNEMPRPQAMLTLAEAFDKEKDNPDGQAELVSLFKQYEETGRLNEEELASVNSLAQRNPEFAASRDDAIGFINTVKATPAYQRMLKRIADTPIDTLVPTEVTVNNAEKVADTLDMATASHLKDMTVDQVDKVLNHSTALRPAQVTKLQAIKTYLQTKVDADINSQDTTRTAGIQKQVYTDLLSHMENILIGSSKGENISAKLRAFKGFVDSQNNKLAALNQAVQTGKRTPYLSFNSKTHEYYQTPEDKGIFFSNTPNGISNAQAIINGSKAAVSAYNTLTQQLGVNAPITWSDVSTQLDAARKGTEQAAPAQNTPTSPQSNTITTPTETSPVIASTEDTNVNTDAAPSTDLTDKVQQQVEKANENTAKKTESTDTKSSKKSADKASTEKSQKQPESANESKRNDPINKSAKEKPTVEDKTANTELKPAKTEDSTNKTTEAPASDSEPVTKAKLKDRISSVVDAGKSKLTSYFKDRKEDLVNFTSAKDLFKEVRAKSPAIAKGISPVATQMKTALNNNLQQYLKKNGLIEKFDKNDFSAMDYVTGRTLALIEKTDTGYKFNDDIIDMSIMAAIDWMGNEGQRSATKQDIEQYQQNDSFKPADIPILASGKLTQDMITGVANNISRFLNISPNPDISSGKSRGIITALASEIIQSVTAYPNSAKPDITLFEIKVLETEDDAGVKKTHHVYVPAIKTNPDADSTVIRSVMFNNRFETSSTEPITTVDKTINHNPLQKLTELQQEQIKAEQAIPFYRHSGMASLVQGWKEEGLTTLFAPGIADEKSANINTVIANQGKINSVVNAYKAFNEMDIELNDKKGDRAINNVPRYFGVAITATGRTMQKGSYTPQSNTLMRYLLLSTQSKPVNLVDDSNAIKAWDFAAAQAFGFDKKRVDENINDFNEAVKKGIDKPYQVLAKALKKANNDMSKIKVDAKELKDAFTKAGIDTVDPRMVHVLLERARFNLSTLEEKKAFETTVHIEADGKTNGPWNLINLYGTGDYTLNEVLNMERGGLFIGSKGRSLSDSKLPDLYVTALSASNDQINSNIRGLVSIAKNSRDYGRANSPSKRYVNNLSHIIKQLGGLEFTDDNRLEGTRAFIKNKVTVMGYFSSGRGMSGKMTAEYANSIYTKITNAIQAMQADSKLSVSDALSQQGISVAALNNIAANPVTVRKDKKGNRYIAEDVKKNASTIKLNTLKDLQEFTFTDRHLNNITSFIYETLGSPIEIGIKSTFGAKVMANAENVVNATTMANMYLRTQIDKAIQDTLDENKKNGIHNQDFISSKQFDDIVNKLKPLFVTIGSNGQEIMIAKLKAMTFGNTNRQIQTSSTMNNRLYSYAEARTPDSVGVSVIPNSTQALGDGFMQIAIKDKSNTLNVYDGWLSPVDKAFSNGVVANEAAYKAIQNNPYTTLSELLDRLDPSEVSKAIASSKVSMDELKKHGLIEENATSVDIERLFTVTKNSISKLNEERNARIDVMSKVSGSMDQMASTQTPYNFGTTDEALTHEQVVAKLNNLLHGSNKESAKEEVSTLKDILTKLADNSDKYSQVISTIISSADTPVRVVDSIKSKDGTQIHGQYNSTTNEILLSKDAPIETVIHEGIHANTFNKVLNYYQGNKTNVTVKAAIIRIEKLLATAEQRLSQLNDTERESVQDMLNTLAQYSGDTPQDKASRLNEFMAWGLSNKPIASRLRQEDVKGSVFTKLTSAIAKAVYTLLETLGMKLTNDIQSQLLFNTAIVVKADSPIDSVSGIFLNHSTRVNITSRLKDVRDFMSERLLNHIKKETITVLNKDKVRDSNNYKIEVPVVDAAKLVMKDADRAFKQEYIDEIGNPMTERVKQAFLLTEEQASTFSIAFTAMALESSIDSAIQGEMNSIHRDFLQKITHEGLVDNVDNVNDFVREHYGLQRYNLLTGVDVSNKSLLAPMFYALALVDPEFNKYLATLAISKEMSTKGSTIDNWLINQSDRVLDSLSNRLAGIKEIPADMEDRVSYVMDSWMKSVQAEQKASLVDTVLTTTGEITEQANDKAVSIIDALGDKLKGYKGDSKAKPYINLLGRMINDKTLIQEMLTDQAAKTTVPAFGALLKDLLGRTDSNGDVYDLIKLKTVHQKIRQKYRTDVPKLIAAKFESDITPEQWKYLNDFYSKVDISVVDPNTDPNKAIADLEKTVRAAYEGDLKVAKAKQLAEYINTGKAGKNLLRNAYLIAKLFGEKVKRRAEIPMREIDDINALVNYYVLRDMDATTKREWKHLAQDNKEGIKYVESFIKEARKKENSRLHAPSTLGSINGMYNYIPNITDPNQSLIIADTDNHKDLLLKGYQFIGQHEGSNTEGLVLGYYYSPTASRAPFNQGVIQNINEDIYGVDLNTGRSVSSIDKTRHGLITTPAEGLVNIYNDEGVIVGQEWLPSGDALALVKKEDNLATNLGIWKGRQLETQLAREFNNTVGDRLVEMWKNDTKGDGSRPLSKSELQKQYVNIADISSIKDIPIKEAINLIPSEEMDMLKQKFEQPDNAVWVRKDLLEDIVGVRAASITDSFTGITRWSPRVQNEFRGIMIDMLGRDAYTKLAKAERAIQGVVKVATENIVVRSLVVPAANMLSNIAQLKANGMPLRVIAKSIPKYVLETNNYSKSEARIVEIDVELAAEPSNSHRAKRLQAEKDSLLAQQKKLSIYPLIAAGEFNTIADLGITSDDGDITSGKMEGYFNKLIEDAPEGVKEAFRQGLIMKDTALFRGLEKTVLYGDFVAKAVLNDYLLSQGKTQKEALARVTDEFVNYDLQMGRDRQALERYGLLWFYNYKIRSLKVGLNILRNNPVHGFMAQYMLNSSPISGTGTPVTDNVLMKGLNGTLPFTVGPEMVMRGAVMHPAASLLP